MADEVADAPFVKDFPVVPGIFHPMDIREKPGKHPGLVLVCFSESAPLKDVFQVLLKYLLSTKKITKTDVSSIMFDLEKQGVLSKKDVSDVFFNLGMKR